MNLKPGLTDCNNNKSNWRDRNKKSNNNDSSEGKAKGTGSKLKYDLPEDYKYEVHPCICYRPQQAFECGRCHHYFHGRISERCKQHPMDFFLMDFRHCPYCLAPITDIKVSTLTWAEIRKIEDANLPNDGDDL
ncbi:uncharacterized protein CG13380 [Drosophila hydei]|uniref:Uncharacterized protein CG13380 n=1 Tax=Drosophila hydei TaxID=7224 RepID=A0A6J1MHT4_DROHY|nr:uncharacterized protein CG13380 [Drosophila hydei]